MFWGRTITQGVVLKVDNLPRCRDVRVCDIMVRCGGGVGWRCHGWAGKGMIENPGKAFCHDAPRA